MKLEINSPMHIIFSRLPDPPPPQETHTCFLSWGPSAQKIHQPRKLISWACCGPIFVSFDTRLVSVDTFDTFVVPECRYGEAPSLKEFFMGTLWWVSWSLLKYLSCLSADTAKLRERYTCQKRRYTC